MGVLKKILFIGFTLTIAFSSLVPVVSQPSLVELWHTRLGPLKKSPVQVHAVFEDLGEDQVRRYGGPYIEVVAKGYSGTYPMELSKGGEWTKQIMLGQDFTAYQVYWRNNQSLVISDIVLIEHNPQSENMTIDLLIENSGNTSSRVLGSITAVINSSTEIDVVSIDYNRHTWSWVPGGRHGSGGGSGGLFKTGNSTFTYPSHEEMPYTPKYNITDGLTYFLISAYDHKKNYRLVQGNLTMGNPDIRFYPVGKYIPEIPNASAITVLSLIFLGSIRGRLVAS